MAAPSEVVTQQELAVSNAFEIAALVAVLGGRASARGARAWRRSAVAQAESVVADGEQEGGRNGRVREFPEGALRLRG